MVLKFIEFCSDYYMVVGITYNSNFDPPECFIAVPITKETKTLTSTIIVANSIEIPFQYAKEVTDKNTIRSLMVLFGT